LVDLEQDLPITADDSVALWGARNLPPLSWSAYLQWLSQLSEQRALPSRLNSNVDEPFEL